MLELWMVMKLGPAVSKMSYYQYACVYQILRMGWLGVLRIKTTQDVDSWNSCCIWLSTENIVPVLDWYFSLKPGQDV